MEEHLLKLRESLERFAVASGALECDRVRFHRHGAVSAAAAAHELHSHMAALQEIGAALAAATKNETPAGAQGVLRRICAGAAEAAQLKRNNALLRELQLESERAIFHSPGLHFFVLFWLFCFFFFTTPQQTHKNTQKSTFFTTPSHHEPLKNTLQMTQMTRMERTGCPRRRCE